MNSPNNENSLKSLKIRNKTYKIKRKIAKGAFGTIYLAEHSQKKVILKVSPFSEKNQFNFCIFNEISFLEELKSERITALLDHDYLKESNTNF